jgi:hypothetical protein
MRPTIDPPTCDLLMDKFQYLANRLCRHLDDPVVLEDPLPEIRVLESLEIQPTVYLRLIGSIHTMTKLVTFDMYEETTRVDSNYPPADFHVHTLEFAYQPDRIHQLVCEYIKTHCVDDISSHLNIDIYIKSPRVFDTHVFTHIVFYHKIRYLQLSGKIHPITHLIEIDSSKLVNEINTTGRRQVLDPNYINLPIPHSEPDILKQYITHNAGLFTTHRGIHIYVDSIDDKMIQMVLSDEPDYSDMEDTDSYQIDSTTDSDSDTDTDSVTSY